MITPELISYIQKQIKNNVSKDLIVSKLAGAGWHMEDIDEGFSSFDMYHEPIEENIILESDKEVPQKENSTIDLLQKEDPKIDDKKIETSSAPESPSPKTEVQKIWVPMSVPVKEKSQPKNTSFDIKKETSQKIEIQNIELQDKKDDLPQNSVSKVVINSFGSVNKDGYSNLKEEKPTAYNFSSEKPINNLSKVAMLSSYRSDLLSASKTNGATKNNKKIKWIISIILLLIVSASCWAFMNGYLNIKSINIFNIKEDPRVLLLSNSKTLSSLKSYKTETDIKITSPSFSNISSGLISGEAISSPDEDSISINTLGIINKNEQKSFSDNFITVKSSLFPDYITADIKSDGSDLFISTPDLSKIINKNAPESSIVKMNENQFEKIPALFPEKIGMILKKINLYNLLSKGIPSYVSNETLNSYDQIINKVEIVEKGVENIKGIDTYHYSINVDRQLAKELLLQVSKSFVLNLSDEDKINLDKIIGSSTIGSFDVWVGKGDNNIYQYNLVLNIPLSKIIGFEDKSIGNNQVSVDWKTTYYDFDVPNNLFMPEKFIYVEDFINNFKKSQIKNEVSSFKKLATDLFNIEKKYGSNSNLSGSCMNPSSSSLFSPVGHSKSSTSVIGSISVLLNKILGATRNNGFCYSTLKDWSFTIPIPNNYDQSSIPEGEYQSFYCVDSNGSEEELTSFPTGSTCLSKTETTTVEKPDISKAVN